MIASVDITDTVRRSVCYLVRGPILGLPSPVPMVGIIATTAGVIFLNSFKPFLVVSDLSLKKTNFHVLQL